MRNRKTMDIFSYHFSTIFRNQQDMILNNATVEHWINPGCDETYMALKESKNETHFCKSSLNVDVGIKGSFIESRMIDCECVFKMLDVCLFKPSTKSITSALVEQKKSFAEIRSSNISTVAALQFLMAS